MRDNSPEVEQQAAGARQSCGSRVVEVLLILAVFFSLVGDPPPHVNEAHYLCRLKHYWNPEWAAGDVFLESQDTQVVLIWLLGWVTRWLSLTATAWAGRVVVWALLAWAWQRLSWRLAPRPLASVLSAALFVTFNTYLHLAGEWVVGGVEGKCFAYAFVLFALREMVDHRWNRVWLLLGAATAFHPLVGGWSGVVCVVIWLINDRRTASLRSMLGGLVGGALLSLPGVVPALMLTWSERPEIVAEANQIYVFGRLPHHLAPLTLPREELVRRVGGHVGLLVMFVLLSRAIRPAEDGLRRIGQFAWGAVVVAVIGFAIEAIFWNRPTVAAGLLRYYWFRLTDFALPAASALFAVAVIADAFDRRSRWAPWLLTAALVGAGWDIAQSSVGRWVNPVPPADQKIRDLPAWIDACEWAGENTRPDALFLTPRLNSTFKWRAGRPEVANRKDLPQDARSIVEWHRRIREIYYALIDGEEEPLDSLGILGTERVRELAEKHGADYVLMDRGQLLSLPIAYKNEEYIIYHIEQAHDGSPTNGR